MPDDAESIPPAQFIPNPVSPIILLKTVSYLARTLIKCGVLEFLEDKAKGTTNPYDDFAVRIASNAIKTLSEL